MSSTTRRPGLPLVIASCLIDLIAWGASWLSGRFSAATWHWLVLDVVFTASACVLAVGVFKATVGTRVALLGRALAMFIALGIALQLGGMVLERLTDLKHFTKELGVLSLLVGLVKTLLLLAILAFFSHRLWSTGLAVALGLIKAASSALFVISTLALDELRELLMTFDWRWSTGATALSIGGKIALAFAAWVPPTTTPEGQRAPTGSTPSVTGDFVSGAVLLALGLLVTLGSYSSASSGSGGGRYIITTGLIAVGIGRIIRGFMRSSKTG